MAGVAGRLALLDVPAAGPTVHAPVLLVPGYTGSKEDFGPLLPLLAAGGHRAVALDQRGQFESDGPPDPTAYTPARLADDLVAVRDALGLAPAHLVGHSFGGLVARAAVLADAVGWLSVTLLDSGPAALPGSRRSTTELLAGAARTVPLEQVWDGVRAFWAAQGHPQADDAATAFQRERFVGSQPSALVGMGEALLAEPDRVDELREAAAAGGVRLAVVFGEHDDAWTPAAQRDMAARLGVPAVAVPGAVHSPAVEAPEETAAVLLSFFAEVEAARVSAGQTRLLQHPPRCAPSRPG